MEEIRAAVFSIDDSKSPGPDEFSAKFYKLHWDDLHESIFNSVLEIFQKKKLWHGHNFITLVPKKDKPQTIAYYRPISYANVFYKIISKIIRSCIKWFQPLLLIVENQPSFIPGKNIGENVLLAHKQIRDFIKRGKPKMCLKIDLQNAYDIVNHNFVCHMLMSIGFPTSIIQLIHECMSTPTLSIIIDARPHGFISSNKGLR